MRNHAKRRISLAGAAALVVIATFALTLPGPAVDASPAPAQEDRGRDVCEQFTYSSCPDRCVAVCTPSSCGPHSCTADCDGPGSCQSP